MFVHIHGCAAYLSCLMITLHDVPLQKGHRLDTEVGQKQHGGTIYESPSQALVLLLLLGAAPLLMLLLFLNPAGVVVGGCFCC